MKLTIQVGALVPPLKEQLKGFKVAHIDHLQADADAIVRLHCRGLITDKEVGLARQRFLKKVLKELRVG